MKETDLNAQNVSEHIHRYTRYSKIFGGADRPGQSVSELGEGVALYVKNDKLLVQDLGAKHIDLWGLGEWRQVTVTVKHGSIDYKGCGLYIDGDKGELICRVWCLGTEKYHLYRNRAGKLVIDVPAGEDVAAVCIVEVRWTQWSGDILLKVGDELYGVGGTSKYIAIHKGGKSYISSSSMDRITTPIYIHSIGYWLGIYEMHGLSQWDTKAKKLESMFKLGNLCYTGYVSADSCMTWFLFGDNGDIRIRRNLNLDAVVNSIQFSSLLSSVSLEEWLDATEEFKP